MWLSIKITFNPFSVHNQCFHLDPQWITHGRKLLLHTALWATIQSVMSQQVFSIIHKGKTPAVTSLIGVWPEVKHALQFQSYSSSFFSDSVLSWSNGNMQFAHNAQMLYTVASVQCVTTNLRFLSGKKNSWTIVVALNITWNLIYAKAKAIKVCSEPNGWVHSNHLQEGMWLLRKDHRDLCWHHINPLCLGLCLKHRHVLYSNQCVLSFKTQDLGKITISKSILPDLIF